MEFSLARGFSQRYNLYEVTGVGEPCRYEYENVVTPSLFHLVHISGRLYEFYVDTGID